MKDKEWVTICTPTYNRRHTLTRVYNSLERQTLKNFIWLIIDDGSTDDTKELIDSFKAISTFEICYFYKQNGGRHTALNYAYRLINTEFVLNLDSDDELMDNAIEILFDTYSVIKKRNDYSRFWAITGRCIDSVTSKVVSNEFPKGVNNLVGKKQHKVITKLYGEKCSCRKIKILKNYPFPEADGINFIPEDLVWETINKDYDQYCINNILRIYHTDSEDSLCKGKVHSSTKWKSAFMGHLFYINDCFDQLLYSKKCLYALLDYFRCCYYADYSLFDGLKKINKIHKRIIVLFLSSIGWFCLEVREKVLKYK